MRPPPERNILKSDSGTVSTAHTNENAVQTELVAGAPNSNADTKIIFNSAAIGSRENALTKDYFAEQNQETLTKKQAHSTAVRRSLTVACGFVGVALLVGATWGVIALLSKSGAAPATPEEREVITGVAYDDALQKAGVNNPEVEVGDAEEDVDAATGVFDQAISDAKTSRDNMLANSLRLAQMEFYFYETDRYDDIIRLSSEIDMGLLSDEEITRYYNCLANAYWGIGNIDEANRIYDLLFELSGGVEYGA